MRLTHSASIILFVSVCLLAGCETQSQWSPTVDTYGNSRAQYLSRDMEECRALARGASGDQTEETVRGAGFGAMAGAAGGALIGAMVGRDLAGAPF